MLRIRASVAPIDTVTDARDAAATLARFKARELRWIRELRCPDPGADLEAVEAERDKATAARLAASDHLAAVARDAGISPEAATAMAVEAETPEAETVLANAGGNPASLGEDWRKPRVRKTERAIPIRKSRPRRVDQGRVTMMGGATETGALHRTALPIPTETPGDAARRDAGRAWYLLRRAETRARCARRRAGGRLDRPARFARSQARLARRRAEIEADRTREIRTVRVSRG